MNAVEANGSKFRGLLAASSIVRLITAFAGRASQTSRIDKMHPYAIKAAQRRERNRSVSTSRRSAKPAASFRCVIDVGDANNEHQIT